MIYAKTIGEFRFVAQTTFYVYVEGNEVPILITSDRKLFTQHKEMAKSGQMRKRKRPIKINYQP